MSKAKELLAKLQNAKTKELYDEEFLIADGQTPDGKPIVIVNTDKLSHLNPEQKMAMVKLLVMKVLSGHSNALVIMGDAGIGKTFLVEQTLEASGRVWEHEQREYTDEELDELVDQPAPSMVMFSGNTTPKGIYKNLYDYREGWIIVFDDCDDALIKSPNIMKSALHNGGRRVISWSSARPEKDLPTKFEFKSRVIFISNMTADQIDPAIRSRCDDLNLVLTRDEAHSYIRKCLPFIQTMRTNDETGERTEIQLPDKVREEIFDKISTQRHGLAEYSFRTFKKAVECYDFAQEHQKELEEVDLTWYDLWLDQQDILDV